MLRIALVFALLGCEAHGRRVRRSRYSQKQEAFNGTIPYARHGRDNRNGQLRALVEILHGSNPLGVFNPSIPHFTRSSALKKVQQISISSRQPPVRSAAPTSRLSTPAQTYEQLADKGFYISLLKPAKTLLSSIMGGYQLGVAGLLCLTVCGNIPGVSPGFVRYIFGALFTVCWILVISTDTQLFTTNTASTSAACFEGKVRFLDAIKNWILAFIGNMIGCGSVACIAAYTGLLTGGTATLAAGIGVAKAGVAAGTFGQMLVRGIIGNYLVNMAIFFAMQARDMMGRYIGILIPISALVASGFENSVVNLFLLPAAMIADAPITLKDVFIKNLVPVTIGNVIASIFLVSAYFSYAFGKLGSTSKSYFK